MRPRTVAESSFGALPFLQHPLEAEVLLDLGPGVVEDLVRDVDQHGLEAALGEVLPQADPHHSGADDADLLDFHPALPVLARKDARKGVPRRRTGPQPARGSW